MSMAGAPTRAYALHDVALAAGDTFAWVILGALTVVVLVASACRVVPGGERLVVFRRGRLVGVKGPGLVTVVPVVDSATRVPLLKGRIDFFRLEATTRDDVVVAVGGSALATVCDPVCYVVAHGSPSVATFLAESEIRRYVAERDLVALTDLGDVERRDLSARITARTEAWGVKVVLVELGRIEVRLKADLIRWAERFGTGTEHAVQRAR